MRSWLARLRDDPDQAPFHEIVEKPLELGRALILANVIFANQAVAKLVEACGLGKAPPNRGRDFIEAKASPRVRIESHQLFAQFGFHQFDSATVHWVTQKRLLAPLTLAQEVVSPAGFEPATY
jgi:hypothetical protein